jgi:flagellar biosynthesis protein FlhF
LRQTLNELQHKHMVLVDTMGMSQKDKLVPELTDMLAGCDVQRLLLLNRRRRAAIRSMMSSVPMRATRWPAAS